MSKNKILLKNIFSVGIIQFANYLFPLLSLPIISRIIGPDKFGVLNFATAYMAYFLLLISYGFDSTAVRRILEKPNDLDHRNKIFNEVLQSQLLLFLVASILFIVSLYSVPELRQDKMVAIFTFLSCFAAVLTQNWLFQAMHDLSKVAILSMVSKVIFTIIVLFVVRHKDDYVWQPLAGSMAALIGAIISFIWSVKRYNLKFKMVSVKQCFNLLWEERFMFVSIIIINFYTNTNVVLLGLFHSASQVAFYSSGIRLVTIFQSIISSVLSQAFFPFVGRAFNESFEKGLETCQKILPLILISTLIVSIGALIVGPTILRFLYGSAFEPSVVVFRILVFTPLIIAFSTVMGVHVMLNLKMDKKFFYISCIGAIFSVAVNFAFVLPYGFIASAFTLLATELMISVLFYISLARKGIQIINLKYFTYQSLKHYTLMIAQRKSD